MNVIDYLMASKLFGGSGGSGGGTIEPLTVSENGTYTPPEGVDGYAPVKVNIVSTESGGLAVEYGTITLAENTRSIKINHSLGVVPKLIFFGNLGDGSTNKIDTQRSQLSFGVFSEWLSADPLRTKNRGLLGYGTEDRFSVEWYTYGTSYANNSFVCVYDDRIDIGTMSMNSGYEMDAGNTYFYLIIG